MARAAALLLVFLLCAADCGGARKPAPAPSGPLPPLRVTLAPDQHGPAPAVSGAQRGGTVTVLVGGAFEHLDPARAYTAHAQLANLLLQRTLTALRITAEGRMELVGDLATDTGRSNAGGRVWTFTLRPGLRFEDGTPITAQDVSYAIARSFEPALADGPTWLQQWLADSPQFSAHYRGVGPPPGITTPNDRTIRFSFARPHPDLPFAAALGTTTPVPRAADTADRYDLHPVATGPYRIESYQRGSRLVLVRNRFWNSATDPVRPAYPDRFVFEFGQSAATATRRVLARTGAGDTSVSWENVPPDLVRLVRGGQAEQNATSGPDGYVGYLKINTPRVRDLAVRRALNCAVDRAGLAKALGGRAVAEPATTLLARNIAGYRDYNAYPCGPSGDAAKAKAMLGGRRPVLRYGYRNNEQGQLMAAFLRDNLRRAGFDLRLAPVVSAEYYSTLRARDNGLDLYVTTWGADWPSGATVLPALLDGRTLTARGNTNTSYFDAPDIDAEIDRIKQLTDLDQAARAWAALDERVMREYAPLVPLYYGQTYTVNGSRLGGLDLHPLLGDTSLVNAYVR